eukprot:CAMPEP_0175816150 /NCGR_PEP_ID=MMETSP0107_2-20121207/6347_1 /TAXON_ID=195067 ORGANISM="Goniomonas pacifica, Strain CCMP1869" /NCGR_SAMPLE_ID=MMETSP0107_2 /ASSEMBLY_ACC=CAM_ASM_000203 /LENGTH=123 /DNA_ID=CAMNT_0017128241 /DNA_START=395 /DNA_END=766 /DNA_ORIENTATION=-
MFPAAEDDEGDETDNVDPPDELMATWFCEYVDEEEGEAEEEKDVGTRQEIVNKYIDNNNHKASDERLAKDQRASSLYGAHSTSHAARCTALAPRRSFLATIASTTGSEARNTSKTNKPFCQSV